MPFTKVLNEREILSVVALSFGSTACSNQDGNKISSLLLTGKLQVTEFHKLYSFGSSNFISSFTLAFGSVNVILSSSSVDI